MRLINSELAGGRYGIVRRMLVSFVFLTAVLFFTTHALCRVLSVDARDYFGLQLSEDVLSQYRHLKKYVERPLEDWQAYDSMQKVFPEGVLFPLAFLNYAVTEMALSEDPAFSKKEAAEVLSRTVEKALSRHVQDVILQAWPDYQLTGPLTPSVIYRGHLNLMLGNYRLLSGDNRYDELHRKLTESLFRDFKASPYKNLQSYPGYCWPADNTVALASLRVYDKSFGTDYASAAREWQRWMAEHALDRETGLMDSRLNPWDGTSMAGPRGCAMSWSLAFLKDVLPEFSKEQYKLYKKHFFSHGGGVTAIREWKRHYQGYQDVDTGPIFFGFGLAASGLGAAATKAMGDQESFIGLLRIGESIGFPLQWRGEKFYFGGFCLLGDTLALWGKVQRPSENRNNFVAREPAFFLLAGIFFVGGFFSVLNWAFLMRRIRLLREWKKRDDLLLLCRVEQKGRRGALLGLALFVFLLISACFLKSIYFFCGGLIVILGLLESIDRFDLKKLKKENLLV
ncbi:MAG: hypothetical protein WCJ71_03730 [Candidatus Omnitrophota bacterium]